MNRDCLVKVVLVGFLHVKLHPHLPVHTGWRKVSVRGPHVRSGELCSMFLRIHTLFGQIIYPYLNDYYLDTFLEFFCMEICVLPFVLPFTYLCQYYLRIFILQLVLYSILLSFCCGCCYKSESHVLTRPCSLKSL